MSALATSEGEVRELPGAQQASALPMSSVEAHEDCETTGAKLLYGFKDGIYQNRRKL